MIKNILILFCAFVFASATTTKPKFDPSAKPVPDSDAQACIKELTDAKFVNQCRNQSMTIWDPLKRGQQMGSIREMCCEMYAEIDCIMNITKNNPSVCKNTKQAMINHQRTLVGWLKRTTCATIRYHDGACDPDQINRFPFPQPIAVANCNAKIYQKVNHCEHQAKKDWVVKSTDNQFSKSVCCSQYQTNDCYVKAAQDMCNQTEFTQFNKYYHDMNMNISKINCTDYQYQSFECHNPNAAFPPPVPPKVLNCTLKSFDKFSACSNMVFKKWNVTLDVLTGRNSCCCNWDLYDCLLTEAQDRCTLPELSEFEQYYNYLAQVIGQTNCTKFGYHAKACKNFKGYP